MVTRVKRPLVPGIIPPCPITCVYPCRDGACPSHLLKMVFKLPSDDGRRSTLRLYSWVIFTSFYATSRVANLLPHLGYRFIHALEASPVHRRQTFQGKALQVNLRGLDRRMPQQLADHLDRYVLFLQGRGERVTDRVRGDRLTHTTSLRQRPQVSG